jgi:hypothetical protein
MSDEAHAVEHVTDRSLVGDLEPMYFVK